MDAPLEITLQIVLAVLAGITAQVVGEFLKVPSIIFLLLFGIAIGPDGLAWLAPQSLGVGLEVLVSLSVAIILFEGGLSLELKELGQVSNSLRNLVTTGVFITLLGGGMAAHWLGEFPWSLAFLYASLVVVTGPTVINPLLRQVKVDRKVATILEGEGVLVDPVGAILAVVVLDITLSGDTDPLYILSGLAVRLGIGALIGVVGGGLLGIFLKRTPFLSEDLRNLVVLAGLWGLWGLAQTVRSESGLMTTVIAGLVVRALSVPDERLLRRFKGQLTILAVSVLFILLAADLSIASVFALGPGAVLTVLVLMVAVRPLNIMLCTAASDLNWRQKLFLSWIAPRGIVSASVASLFAILLTERGISGGEAIKALVFLTIIMTVMLQGLTAGGVANLLKVTNQRESSGVVIVGCNPLSLLIARMFNEEGESVMLIDTKPEAARLAEPENLPLLVESALDNDVLEKAGLSSAGTFLAITNNGEVNAVMAQQAQEEFQPPRVVAVFPEEDVEEVPAGNKKPKSNNTKKSTPVQKVTSQKVPVSTVPLKTWNTYLKEGAVRLGETRLREKGGLLQRAHLRALMRSGELIPLVIKREEGLRVALVEEDWQSGDRVVYLLHDPKPKLLQRLSGGSRPTRLMVETLPTVEEVPLPMRVVEPKRPAMEADGNSADASETSSAGAENPGNNVNNGAIAQDTQDHPTTAIDAVPEDSVDGE